MPDAINTTADKIWSAIQRPSPAVTRDEIIEILMVAMDAPLADENDTSLGEQAAPYVGGINREPSSFWNNGSS